MSLESLDLPPLDGDLHLWLGFSICLLEVPWFVELFVAARTQHVESAAWTCVCVANKVCAVVESFLASAAQTKLVFVAFIFHVIVAPVLVCVIPAAVFVSTGVRFA